MGRVYWPQQIGDFMAKKVTKKSKKVVKKASKKKAVVKKAGRKKVSSVDYPTEAPSAGWEVYLPTGGTRKLAVNELTPSLQEELRSYANEEVRHQVEGIGAASASALNEKLAKQKEKETLGYNLLELDIIPAKLQSPEVAKAAKLVIDDILNSQKDNKLSKSQHVLALKFISDLRYTKTLSEVEVLQSLAKAYKIILDKQENKPSLFRRILKFLKLGN